MSEVARVDMRSAHHPANGISGVTRRVVSRPRPRYPDEINTFPKLRIHSNTVGSDYVTVCVFVRAVNCAMEYSVCAGLLEDGPIS